MSTDNESAIGMDNPIANIDPPKSKKKFWIFGGLGCLGLIGLVCAGGGFFVYQAGIKPFYDFQKQNVTIGAEAPEVENVLGSPVTSGTTVAEKSGDTSFTFRTPLTGPQGEGTLVFGGGMEGVVWTREYIYLEVNGQQIDLDPEAMFDLGISEGE